MQDKPNILITNDDGINAPGIWHLWNALKDIGNIFIVAPKSERSGSGLATTMGRPLLITPVKWENDTPAWMVNGTPADCVKLGLSVLLENTRIDLIASGINRGTNAGLPKIGENDETIWDFSPEEMVRYARIFISMGATIIGGCCGTAPAHIAVLASELKT